ncbi:selenium-dependent xanthine dehydrogenase [Candidatus Formimonas warabiya]|uniref:Selenium-dependent xanthine dehydrogenase n=1 Tax=Formimonas warabiya TaxID=1761012 RepID=A0A3G1L1F4_FORW1|nr:selenium-dependent xanthine dehydrogenase [Candidatus Formimonas warabiya]ATW28474.1 selenium-dependent xanthine dehydrogenase [Candidatus Formimonas warabiya]
MFTIDLNGNAYQAKEDMNLLDFLRDELHVTSLKNGCGEGSCGACMVLVDGKAQRACLLTLAKVDSKRLITVEGLTDREKEVYAWAFTKAGAVQCGFCIPGMVISAKGLLDKKPQPTPQEIKEAIRGNICRCTGYVKIEQAIDLAARVFRGELAPAWPECSGIGSALLRLDGREKVLGTGQYVDDMHVQDMLYGAVLRTKYPRALVKHIDVSAVRTYPGVEAVLTAEDVPGSRLEGYIFKDWPVLIGVGEETRYVGDAIALVAATSKKAARAALEMIQVDYEELPPVTTPVQALQEGAPQLHPRGNLLSKTYVKRGNPEDALGKSKYVVTKTYQTPPTEHAFMEPESALAVPDHQGGITVYAATQSVHKDKQGIAHILGLTDDKVRVISKYVGGGFGGKEDLSVQHHAALLARDTGKPVKLTLTRKESLLVHPKRHAMTLEISTGCDGEGRLTAMVAKIVADTGAYASLGPAVLERACTHVPGPYRIPHIELTGLCVYTNNPPAGAFRGFGVTQSVFAGETNLDLLAEQVGISPWEIRYRNALDPGDVMATGQIADADTAVKETLMAVRDTYFDHPGAGIACALKNSGIGVGLPDIGRCKLVVTDGRVRVLTSAQCIGQGLATVMLQIVSTTTGLPEHLLDACPPDTELTPDAGSSTASRQTLFTGEAARQAALKLAERLKEATLAELDGQEFSGEYRGITDSLTSDKPHPVHHVAYSYATHVVILDEQGKVKKVVAAHDVGRAINPLNIEGQIEGGVAMGLGYALREDFPLNNAVPTAKFGTLGLFRSTDMPEIQTIVIEKNASSLAYGAKGIGEISAIPTTAAVASAYYKYDGKIRLQLPLRDTAYRK